jgi:Ca2+:H+ antiporter
MVFLWLLVTTPIALALRYLFHASPLWVFAAAVVAVVPLAEWIRRATEQLAERAGSAIGGLLNVTFGNMAELVLAIFVLRAGRADVVKAQITGSIIGNSLLGLGLAILAGSWRRVEQRFDRERAGLLSTLLLLSVIALLVPALFDLTERRYYAAPQAPLQDERFSLGAAVVLIAIYVGNLVFTLITHRDVFAREDARHAASHGSAEDRGAESIGWDLAAAGSEGVSTARGTGAGTWPLWRSLGVLQGGTIFIAWHAELIAGALESTARQLGLTEFFLGVTVLAVTGNAAEYIAAIYFARRDRMGLVMSITAGSSIQVALLIAPVLVLVSHFLGRPMDLVFANPLELVAVASAAFAVRAIAEDGKCNWFEGALLVGVYILLGLAFLYATPPSA